MLKGVVFDFDGVLVDSEPLHYEAFSEVLTPLGFHVTWEEYQTRYIGFDDRDALSAIFADHDQALSLDRRDELIGLKASVFESYIDQGRAAAQPGAFELIGDLRGHLPMAICSGALLNDILPVLKARSLTTLFDCIITAEDVQHSKPDPACYHLARQGLASGAFAPEECLVIEDTPGGISAAKAAGLRVLAVATTHTEDYLQEADWVYPGLDGVNRQTLQRCMEGRAHE